MIYLYHDETGRGIGRLKFEVRRVKQFHVNNVCFCEVPVVIFCYVFVG